MSYATIPTHSMEVPTKPDSPKMHPAIKQRWVRALRSGEYQQSAGCLRTADGFCCLGVLCDLYAKEHGLKWTNIDKPTDHGIMGEFVYLPTEVAKWANIDKFGIIVRELGTNVDLSDLNDKGHPFRDIATAIDENL